jgi:hypothetical protein
MSRISLDPARLNPSDSTSGFFLRVGIALTVIVAVLAFAVRAQAQQVNTPTISVRPIVGALVAVGSQHDAMKNGVLVGGQGAWALDPNFAVLGTFGWSRSQDLTSAQQPNLDLYQYDLGLEGRTNDLTRGTVVITRPYAAVGAGARTYDLRNVVGTHLQTNPLLYSALGVELDHSGGVFGLRLEARDNITAFKGFRGEFADRTARHDLQFSAGLTFGL